MEDITVNWTTFSVEPENLPFSYPFTQHFIHSWNKSLTSGHHELSLGNPKAALEHHARVSTEFVQFITGTLIAPASAKSQFPIPAAASAPTPSSGSSFVCCKRPVATAESDIVADETEIEYALEDFAGAPEFEETFKKVELALTTLKNAIKAEEEKIAAKAAALRQQVDALEREQAAALQAEKTAAEKAVADKIAAEKAFAAAAAEKAAKAAADKLAAEKAAAEKAEAEKAEAERAEAAKIVPGSKEWRAMMTEKKKALYQEKRAAQAAQYNESA